MSNLQCSVIKLFPVELWREVFGYFNSNELWFSFRGLNNRIDEILSQTALHINFEKKGNHSCFFFMKNILPTMNVSNIQSVKLGNYDVIKDFFSIYSLGSLVQLRLLSLPYMYSFNDNSFAFWNQLASLKHLKSLELMLCGGFGHDNCIDEKEFIILSVFNKDFCPLLKRFTIGTPGRMRYTSIPSLITTTNTTNIEYMSLGSLTFNDLIKLLPALQNVKSFCIDYQLYHNNESNEQQQKMTTTISLMPKCTRLHLKLSDDIMFEHVEYILKHTPNLTVLFLWGWWHLLDAKKWEALLSTYCPKLLKLDLICTANVYDDDFGDAEDNFEQDCATIRFWIERNVRIIYEEDFSAHDYRDDIVVRFNIQKMDH
ncbi:unnamed protein product [Adineta steineri]|uniref:F-box domain-containing protein n=1 Tax=Adineta steineri TaxID=433720 RepID=A0A815B9C1_9BILA|nr:unnamed protein product [Adineta steineri]CAF1267359.1 unnamed protein product [Adineta steineri]CAF1406942.1 unnamed protein product [Adineta steineri]CAF1616343.1 unnamed protein product [Adineta steineri]